MFRVKFSSTKSEKIFTKFFDKIICLKVKKFFTKFSQPYSQEHSYAYAFALVLSNDTWSCSCALKWNICHVGNNDKGWWESVSKVKKCVCVFLYPFNARHIIKKKHFLLVNIFVRDTFIFSYVTLSFSCVTLSISCVTLSFSCVTLSFSCVTLSFSCATLSFSCVTLSFSCVTLSFSCVTL